MNWFEILVGIASIGSFAIAVIALFKVNKVEKTISISKDNTNKTRQSAKKTKVENGSITQIGRDHRGGQ